MFDGGSHELPPLAAAFLIEFDNRAGYTIKWQRSISDVQLEGVVEYKSLPSGLHNIKEDLVYFIHHDYAGLSAFHNEPASESERNAHMLAVGVLVPLSYGRLGKSWRHAQGLKDLARQLAADDSQTDLLEDYWEQHRIQDTHRSEVSDSPFASPSVTKFKDFLGGKVNGGPHRNRATSDATPLSSSQQTLSPYHPALSLPEFITTFGPLVFPLYRAALLRKRILIIGEPPVQMLCNFVYDLSILANIPFAVHSILPSDLQPLRLRPLFNVGIHDIPFLEKLSIPDSSSQSDDSGSAWVAFTTDHVLATKTHLYDVLVILPPAYSKNASSKVYPKISTPHPPPSNTKAARQPSHSPYPSQYPVKATQRDARRYVTLRRGLRRLPRSDPLAPSFPKISIPKPSSNNPSDTQNALDDSDAISTTSSTTPSILEPLSWPLFAYNSFIWWASAGEARTDLEEESTNDTDLLFTDIDNLAITQPSIGTEASGLNSTSDLDVTTQQRSHCTGRRSRGKSISQVGFGKGAPVREMALVAYFHRLTTLMFSSLAEVIAREDSEGKGPNGNVDGEVAETEEHHDTHGHNGSTAKANGHNQSQDRNGKRNGKRNVDSDPSESDPLMGESESSDGDEEVIITAEDVSTMGLDVWSEADRCFIEDVAGIWFGRRARVIGGRVECCGVRVY